MVHNGCMSKLLDRAIAAARQLPADLQDEIGAIMLDFMREDEAGAPYVLTPEEIADLEEAEREVERGEIATEEDVRAMWAKYGL